MNETNRETLTERLERYKNAALNLTQDQIDAMAWVMGGSGAGWDKDSVVDAIFRSQMALDQ